MKNSDLQMIKSGINMVSPHLNRWLFVAALVILPLQGCGNDSSKAQSKGGMPPPPAVVVERAVMSDFILQSTYTGRIEAIDKVDIRARVSGYLKKRHFVEGSEIKKGELLFEIEQAPFEIAVHEAQANLAAADAALELGKSVFDRTSTLVERKTISKATLDTARATLLQARATVQARKADLQKVQLDLGYTRITAPFSGRAGRAAFSEGAYITTSSGSLVMLVAQDPTYVKFPVPQKQLLEVQRSGGNNDGMFVELTLADGSVYEEKGKILFSDVQATSGTDSVIVRASIANPDRLLVDQQLVQVSVVRKKPDPQLSISQSALLIDQQGTYVFVVDDDNKIVINRIVTGKQLGSLTSVISGLKVGDRVVISGHQKVQPGKPVTPSEPQSASKATSKPSSGEPDAKTGK
jgi:membrane fusion protein, multidrug efflux system